MSNKVVWLMHIGITSDTGGGIMPCASCSCGPSARPAVRRRQRTKHVPVDMAH